MKEFSWKTPEYIYTEKTSDWYWTVGIVSAAIVVVSIIFGDTLFGLIVAIGAFSLTMFASRKPRVVAIEINQKGVAVERVLYPFPSIDSFFVDAEHRHGPRLFLKSKKVVVPLIDMPIATTVDTEELRTFLSAHLEEEVVKEGVLHGLFERLGF